MILCITSVDPLTCDIFPDFNKFLDRGFGIRREVIPDRRETLEKPKRESLKIQTEESEREKKRAEEEESERKKETGKLDSDLSSPNSEKIIFSSSSQRHHLF